MHLSRSPDTASDAELALMLRDLGNPFGAAVPPLDSRCLALSLADLYQQKGTAPGIKNAVHWIVGVRVARIDCYNIPDEEEGESEEGEEDDGPQIEADEQSPYSFVVKLEKQADPETLARVAAVVEFMKPAHTHLVKITHQEVHNE